MDVGSAIRKVKNVLDNSQCSHFEHLVAYQGYGSEDSIIEFFADFVVDRHFMSKCKLPARWTRVMITLAFLSLVECATILKDVIGSTVVQQVIDMATEFGS